jgi:hypothetical protein
MPDDIDSDEDILPGLEEEIALPAKWNLLRDTGDPDLYSRQRGHFERALHVRDRSLVGASAFAVIVSDYFFG